MRIVVEPSDYRILNRGDAASLHVALARLHGMWPAAAIDVLTEDPAALVALAPFAAPVLTDGHRSWTEERVTTRRLPPGLVRALPSLPLQVEAEVRNRWPEAARRRVARGLRESPGAVAALDAYFESVSGADLVVVAGMGGLTDAFTRYTLGVLATVALAARHRVPTAMMSQQVGPLAARMRHLARPVLRAVDLIALREARESVPLLAALGVDGARVRVTGDDTVAFVHGRAGAGLGDGIGLNVRASHYSGVDLATAAPVGAAARAAARRLGAPLVALPVSRNPDEDDAGAIAALTGGPADTADTGPPVTDLAGFARLVATCRVVVTGSYHGAVFALAQGIPAVCLSNSRYYDQKFLGLADLFGPGCSVVRFGGGMEARLAGAIDQAWAEAPDVRDSLLAAAARQTERGAAAYADLATLVSATPDGRQPAVHPSRAWTARAVAPVVEALPLAATAVRRVTGRPDIRRWSDPASFRPGWDARARVMARLVPPGATVLDVGAGPVGIGPWLDPACDYVALDLVPRGPGSIVCDLNRRPFPDLDALGPTVAVLGGVLEYLREPGDVVAWLSRYVSTFVVSYEPAADALERPLGRVRQVASRARAGWVGSLTESELHRMFSERGFAGEGSVWWDSPDGPGRVFRFTRASARP